VINRAFFGGRGFIDFLAESQGCLADFVVRSFVSQDRWENDPSRDDNGIVADFGVEFRAVKHESGEDDERIGFSDQEAPVFELVRGRLCL